MVNDNIAGAFLCNDMDLQVVEEVVENIVVVDKLYRQALSRVLIDLTVYFVTGFRHIRKERDALL